MGRDYFKRTTGNAARVDGSIISDIQASLNAITAFGIRVDGSFGRQTEQAVSGFQSMRSLPVTGTVSDVTWVNFDAQRRAADIRALLAGRGVV